MNGCALYWLIAFATSLVFMYVSFTSAEFKQGLEDRVSMLPRDVGLRLIIGIIIAMSLVWPLTLGAMATIRIVKLFKKDI